MRDKVETTRSAKIADAFASGCVSRELFLDLNITQAELDASGHWEKDFLTGAYHKRTPEFIAALASTKEALVQQRKDAEITLAMAVISLEGHLPPQQDGPPGRTAPNGEPYVLVCSWDIEEARRIGNDKFDYAHKTSSEAIAAWKHAAFEHAQTHQGDVLWWRTRPEIRGEIPFGSTEARWYVYSRLMIGTASIDTVSEGEVESAEVPLSIVYADFVMPHS